MIYLFFFTLSGVLNVLFFSFLKLRGLLLPVIFKVV